MHSFPATTNISASQAVLATPTIANIRQWDPDPSISLQTFQRLQGIRSYYTFPSLGVDRYTAGGAAHAGADRRARRSRRATCRPRPG